MNLTMTPIELVGLKVDLRVILYTLRRLGCVHIEDLSEMVEVSARPLTLDRETLRLQEDRTLILARMEGLLDALGVKEAVKFKPVAQALAEKVLDEARAGVDLLLPKVQSLRSRRDRLQAELASLPRYETTLRKLLPMIPASAQEAGNRSVGVLVSRAHMAVLDTLAKQALDLSKGQAEVVGSDIDLSTRAMWIVFPSEYGEEIDALLGREDVTRLRLPAELGEGPPMTILTKLKQRMIVIPQEINEIEYELAGLAEQWRERLGMWREVLREELDASSVLARFGETDLTFILVGWVPAPEFERVQAALKEEVGGRVYIHPLEMTPELKKIAPVILHNPTLAQPFESLVKLISLPRYGHIDPTQLMAFFMPVFFGMILGDVGYGILLLLLSLGLLRRFKQGVARDIMIVLAMGSGWSIVFGFLFGEAFGSLGEYFGLHALWFDRASAEYVGSLLLMTLAVGAVHITLGLILGVREAVRERSRGHLLERGGMLLGLISLFFLVGVLAKALPAGFLTPAIAGLILGIVLLGSSLGWLGIIMGPIEFIGLIGNILSYLRIAAIGLASVYLAKVANDMAGMSGSVLVGVILAVLIHALNLVLGAFSPTIHSLRLHYVEFFRKFYEGGGKPYQPFRSHL